MKPPLAALVAAPFAVLGLALGILFGGIAHWLVALLGGLVGLAWLAPWVQALVILLGPPVAAGGAHFALAHGEEPALTAGLLGVAAGALAGAAAMLIGLLGWVVAIAVLVAAPAALGSAAALAAGVAGRPAPQP